MSESTFNNKGLIGIVILLIVIFVGTEMYRNSQRNAGNRLPELVQFDSTEVSRIIIEPMNGDLIEVRKESANQWRVEDGQKAEAASLKEVRSFLEDLTSVRALRLISKTEDRWKDYGVTDSLALKVKVFVGDEEVVDLLVGRTRFNPSTGGVSGYTYVRRSTDVETYSSEGFISTNLNKGFDQWRNNQVLVFKKSDLEDMVWTYPADSGFVLNQTSAGWKLNNNAADSAKAKSYIVTAKNKVSRDFVYGQNYADPAPFSLKVNLKGQDPIVIRAWPNKENEEEFIIHSSLNEDAWFSSSKTGLFKQLFPSKFRFTN